jgi:hypothetical protein
VSKTSVILRTDLDTRDQGKRKDHIENEERVKMAATPISTKVEGKVSLIIEHGLQIGGKGHHLQKT